MSFMVASGRSPSNWIAAPKITATAPRRVRNTMEQKSVAATNASDAHFFGNRALIT
jgi:hypothetical protein